MRLMTLNIEGDRHMDLWLPAVKDLNVDVLCLQELFEVDCQTITAMLGLQCIAFATTTRMEQPTKYKFNLKGNWGVGLFSKLPVTEVKQQYYSEDSTIRVFAEPNDPRRVLVSGKIQSGEQEYQVATTHFTWSPAGEAIDLQYQDFERLAVLLQEFPEIILCGDFNAPRGRAIHNLFVEKYRDVVPEFVKTTIDSSLHYSGKELELVVDGIFLSPEYQAEDVQVIDGISDHKGILAEIVRD